MSSEKQSSKNVTMMKSILRSELKKIFQERDKMNRIIDSRLTKLKEFDTAIDNKLKQTKNTFLHSLTHHNYNKDSIRNMVMSLNTDLDKYVNTRNEIIRDVRTDMNYLSNLLISVEEFKQESIDDIKSIIMKRNFDNNIKEDQYQKMSNDVFKEVLEDILNPKKKSKEFLSELNKDYRKRYRTPSISPPSLRSSPTKLSQISKKQVKRVKVDESKNVFVNKTKSSK